MYYGQKTSVPGRNFRRSFGCDNSGDYAQRLVLQR